MKVFSIGFTQKSAKHFFQLLSSEKISTLVDVRLNNSSQLAGFAKKDDLAFFLRKICQLDYVHLPDLAPTKAMLDAYKKGQAQWQEYENDFINLMIKRNIEKMDKSLITGSCLLCSEHKPHHCHRRLVIEYLNRSWGMTLEVKHLW